jgi:hypothetical protein
MSSRAYESLPVNLLESHDLQVRFRDGACLRRDEFESRCAECLRAKLPQFEAPVIDAEIEIA